MLDAIQYLNTAIEREPSFSQYHFVKGQLYLNTENFDEAAKALNKAIELDPNYAFVYSVRGEAKIKLGQKDSGFADFKKAVELGYAEAQILIKQYTQ